MKQVGWRVMVGGGSAAGVLLLALLGVAELAEAHLGDGGDPTLIHACVKGNGDVRIVR